MLQDKAIGDGCIPVGNQNALANIPKSARPNLTIGMDRTRQIIGVNLVTVHPS